MQDCFAISWRSRGYLPHFDSDSVQQHIVFSLADAIAEELVVADARQRLWEFDRALDRGAGSCLLAKPACAQAIQDALPHHDVTRYRLLAWCIMPNHVHVVVDAMTSMSECVRLWKTWSARQINRISDRTGALWRREYFDRFARNENHLRTMIHYVENNPVAAGLAASAVDWKWSSAAYRELAGQEPGGPG